MISNFDHFLLYASEPEKTFQFLKNRFQLNILIPLTNFGPFQSGMFVFQNGILEILWYENKSNEEKTNFPINQFVGFALQSDLDLTKTKRELENLEFTVSNVMEQKVFNAKSEEVVISEIVMLDRFLGDFQTFFIEYKTEDLRKKFEELSKTSLWEIDSFILETANPEEIRNGFLSLGFKQENDHCVSDSNGIKVKFEKTFSQNGISSFVIQSKEEKVDILQVLKEANG
ncbi:hypothetical protein [Leptospira bandrabouensis]|uniref:hypothetical protein n=1 Tax=Leptospira bandrabouensis TaxID=2484903 RepID=UPI001EE9462D|nr:hypothetical protein [Leptospira bandrabouensis]MCG6144378.1 hypothetical protein [Leptospira bandrabouensis]MCG6150611.1 hypothetical protein [Leptospira bandrabouensis]MCG6160039.1 hypothetical protein [Leptospira bandrabouensis]MCG6163972.1 hypothetical protein [Leptospira bandrabouensis]